ncbi:prolipoprotein diacylglyceryl transferase [Candidatus Woesearchaeota archaeon]|nr:prolipoprotein diacylglyceryl transferase [Candidatus Woesearchaeota archaeon]
MALPYQSFMSWQLGPITIQSYGVLVALAFLVATLLAVKEAKRRRLDSEKIYGLVIWLIVGGIFGSRLMYVIGNWSYFFPHDMLAIFKIWQGGLDWIGGFIGAAVAGLLHLKFNKLKPWKYADACAPSIAIGHAIGRIGCILGDGGHVGKLTTMPWGFLINGEIRHVTAWYGLILESFNFLILWKLRKKKYFDGFLLAMYIFIYSIGRFIIDFFRADPLHYSLTATQWILIALFLISGYFLYTKLKNKIKIKIK